MASFVSIFMSPRLELTYAGVELNDEKIKNTDGFFILELRRFGPFFSFSLQDCL